MTSSCARNSSKSRTIFTLPSSAVGAVKNGSKPRTFISIAMRAGGDGAADAAQADDAQRLAGELRALVAGCASSTPAARILSDCVGRRDLAGQRHHQRQRVLGGRKRGRLGGVEHEDALGGGGFEVDVVHAHARAGDRLELVRVLQDLAR